MERHNYVRSGKFKNVNCGYALINGIVFGSIYDAEAYCTRENLDVNTWIEADSPEVLSRCQQIAKITLPGLRLLKDNCSILFRSLCAMSEKKATARDEAEKTHELGWEVHNDWVIRAGGKVSGCYDCMELVSEYIATLERIIRIKL